MTHRAHPTPSIHVLQAYSSMLRNRVPSSITISGESGAGKTESAKQCLLFISHVSGAQLSKGSSGKPAKPGAPPPPPKTAAEAAAAKATLVKDRLLTSTLILEAFGNAATLRNNNSSRFGKLQSVFFSPRGIAIGGRVDQYLLEKARVTRQREERNFHAFYYIAAALGGSAEGRAIHLEQPPAYAYLGREHRKVPGLNDAGMFRSLVQCMTQCGIDAAAQKALWRAMSVVLNLGNVELTSEAEKEVRVALAVLRARRSEMAS